MRNRPDSPCKPALDARRLHELLRARWLDLNPSQNLSQVLTTAQPTFDLPHPHPRDALGRNWDVARVRNVHSAASARVVIDQLREAYDVATVS